MLVHFRLYRLEKPVACVLTGPAALGRKYNEKINVLGESVNQVVHTAEAGPALEDSFHCPRAAILQRNLTVHRGDPKNLHRPEVFF